MGKLIYGSIMSLDGYVNDEHGNFDWAMPSEEVHAFVNDLERGVGTYLYGRRMYEIMVWWETVPTDEESEAVNDFASVWRAADKIVYSTTLDEVSSARTRLEPAFDPEAIKALKATTDLDITIGGPTLAAAAFEAGLVDECQLILVPVLVGAGTRALPAGLRLDLQLNEQRRFENGMAYLSYRV
jgi:dihydrofolate reductase